VAAREDQEQLSVAAEPARALAYEVDILFLGELGEALQLSHAFVVELESLLESGFFEGAVVVAGAALGREKRIEELAVGCERWDVLVAKLAADEAGVSAHHDHDVGLPAARDSFGDQIGDGRLLEHDPH
jgi:hypothetical protein